MLRSAVLICVSVVSLVGCIAATPEKLATKASFTTEPIACPKNAAQEPSAWYVGAYHGPDSAVSGMDQARDVYCARKFKERYPNGFVTVFGSSSIKELNDATLFVVSPNNTKDKDRTKLFQHFYKDVENFSSRWTKLYGPKYPILAGAGPGLMEAANKGASEAGGPSIGYTTYYWSKDRKEFVGEFYRPESQSITTDGLIFSTVSARETAMITHSAAIVFAPGGTGTSWEVYQTLEMLKSQQLAPVPIYFLGTKRDWAPVEFTIREMVSHGTVQPGAIKIAYTPCVDDLINRLAYDLKLSGKVPTEPTVACKAPAQ